MLWSVYKIKFLSSVEEAWNNAWQTTSRCLFVASSATPTISLKRGDQIFDVLFRSEKDRRPLVDRLWLEVEDRSGSGGGQSSGLFYDVRHRDAFVQKPQLYTKFTQ